MKLSLAKLFSIRSFGYFTITFIDDSTETKSAFRQRHHTCSVMVLCQCPIGEDWGQEQPKADFLSVTALSPMKDYCKVADVPANKDLG